MEKELPSFKVFCCIQFVTCDITRSLWNVQLLNKFSFLLPQIEGTESTNTTTVVRQQEEFRPHFSFNVAVVRMLGFHIDGPEKLDLYMVRIWSSRNDFIERLKASHATWF